ncbi:hypothetical protein T459_25338 [Capsicum annuum]|uniref:Uncharacterized protein n=1 Tax=Capsicum annuum TaxID=4072 RepID=A0A2G2YKG9_CAPAN|nr:hypothetical protein T459_25338 [Capsicum annuum]
MNVVVVLPSVGVHESSFCDTLDIVRSHEDQTLVVGTQALVDPLDDDIDSPHENDLCPSSASTYNLTKIPLPSDESIHTLVDPCEKQGESTLVCELPTTSEGEKNDQPGVNDLDLLEYLENSSCDCICEDDFDCGPLASRDGLYVCEDNSCETEGDMCLEMPSTSSLCVSYVGHIPSENFETSSKCMHGNPLFEIDLWNTFLNPLLVHDIFNSEKEGFLNFEDDTLGESESGRDLSPWLCLPFNPGNFLGLGSNSWKRVGDVVYHIDPCYQGIMVNGKMHWLTLLGFDNEYFDRPIVFFELADEVFGEVPIVNFGVDPRIVQFQIVVLGGCIVVALTVPH